MTELEDNVTLCKKSLKISKGQKQKVKKTNKNLQTTTQKIKDWAT